MSSVDGMLLSGVVIAFGDASLLFGIFILVVISSFFCSLKSDGGGEGFLLVVIS